MSDTYHVVAALSEMSEGHQMYIELDGEEILLCQHEGEYFAINYFCSHAEFGLEGGSIRDGCITCPYHGAEFCLKDGSVQAPPAFEGIKTYPLKIVDETIAISSVPNPAIPG
ncbi:MAG: Rieske 2Fe-2S domain-containing protein [Pseudomonadales bacterium]|jgi:3-phenylpropionate/trans-cinnamate dioxygenase ferredoxin subunit|nr:Rieske 2Fe-2S domain-containing protein [Pseudomonadales bacterium]MDG1444610.1 Rieske 2Fe-2S domain-containing protein [Pseudomonadales bacterium]